MRHPLRLIFVFAMAVFVYVICDNLWGLSSNWQIEQVLSMWQIAIMGVGLVAATAAVYYAAMQFRQRREQETQARQESLSQLRHSLRSELETNLGMLHSEMFKILHEKGHTEYTIAVRPLKTSVIELIAGREDLKYFSPAEAMYKVAEAYDQIKDFNILLDIWFSRAALQKERMGYYPSTNIKEETEEMDLSIPTTKQLAEQKKETIAKIKEALKVL